MHGPNSGNRSILLFVFLYCIGRFMGIYYPRAAAITEKISPWIIYISLMIVFFVVVSFSPTIIARGINYLSYPYNSFILISFAIIFFYCFKSLNIHNKWINWFAKSSFAIYLIHGQPIVSTHRWLYDIYAIIGLQIENPNIRLLFLLGAAFAICLLCIAIDQVRIAIFKYCGIDKLINTVDKLINKKTELFKITY